MSFLGLPFLRVADCGTIFRTPDVKLDFKFVKGKHFYFGGEVPWGALLCNYALAPLTKLGRGGKVLAASSLGTSLASIHAPIYGADRKGGKKPLRRREIPRTG